ncbi:MAG TPA: DUF2520 domain-containing protein [Candidatus Dormibacteraeota bacterium]|nr:DUF2520 domain-containing protein [Candidatus Dormibacteraeota bacterium]
MPARAGFRLPRAGILFLAVPDGAVAEMAGRIAALDPPSDLAIVHVSGALGLDALGALHGNPRGSFHPLQSFPSPRTWEAFKGITIAIDATTPGLLRELRRLARLLAATPRRVRDSERVLYHAAAVFASNYVVAVVEEAVRLLGAAGWRRADAEAALIPLVEGAVESIRRQGVVGALTGPIRRGDSDTVARHLEAVDDADLYRMLGTIALEIAGEAGLEPAAAERVRRALTRNVAATRRRRR